MNRRIRKKKIDQTDRMLANALRLYATRPRPREQAAAYEKLATSFLGLSIGLALRERLQRLPGPRHGCEMDPPRAVAVTMPGSDTIEVSGLVLIRDRQGEAELVTESFQLRAHKHAGSWRITRVLMAPVAREVWEAAV